MSDETVEGLSTSASNGPKTAGALLREARQAQGMHIAALAAAIKVAPRKLEALEADRYDELVDATFTRALAMTVCRALKIDPAPILERLPQSNGKGLDQVSAGLNATFRERGARREGTDWRAANRPAVWGAVALLAAAGAVMLLPSHWLPSHWFGEATTAPTPTSAASASAAMVATPHVVREPVSPPVLAPSAASAALPLSPMASSPTASAPNLLAATAASAAPTTRPAASAAPGGGGLLRIETTTGASWVDVRDAAGKTLISRLVPAGETVTLDGTPPLNVKVGHAAVTRLTFRGQPVPLSPHDTVVRMELK
jgi:cytoskeleton protein RodZ